MSGGEPPGPLPPVWEPSGRSSGRWLCPLLSACGSLSGVTRPSPLRRGQHTGQCPTRSRFCASPAGTGWGLCVSVPRAAGMLMGTWLFLRPPCSPRPAADPSHTCAQGTVPCTQKLRPCRLGRGDLQGAPGSGRASRTDGAGASFLTPDPEVGWPTSPPTPSPLPHLTASPPLPHLAPPLPHVLTPSPLPHLTLPNLVPFLPSPPALTPFAPLPSSRRWHGRSCSPPMWTLLFEFCLPALEASLADPGPLLGAPCHACSQPCPFGPPCPHSHILSLDPPVLPGSESHSPS